MEKLLRQPVLLLGAPQGPLAERQRARESAAGKWRKGESEGHQHLGILVSIFLMHFLIGHHYTCIC